MVVRILQVSLGLLFVWGVAGTRQDPPPNQHYDLKLLVHDGFGGFSADYAGAVSNLTEGPAGEAECYDLIKGLSMDDNGDAYWASSPYPLVMGYNKDKNMVSVVAGSAFGNLDGPLERARFSGWGYNSTNKICVSDDGKHMFVADNRNSIWRYIDFESKMVSTVGPTWDAAKGAALLIAKDCKTGEICAFMNDGSTPPDCKGYRKLVTANWKFDRWWSFDGIALDAGNMKFYFHCRYESRGVNLLTGDSTILTSRLYCPTGMSISAGGNYLYIGGGDHQFCWRKDLTTGEMLAFGRSAAGGTANGVDVYFKDQTTDFANPISTSSDWPSACVFSSDGQSGFWPTCWGIYFMVPRN